MRRTTSVIMVAVALVSVSCGGGSSKKATPKKTTTSARSTTSTTFSSSQSTSTTSGSTASTASTSGLTSTTACNFAGTTGPQTNGIAPATMLLTKVDAAPDGCLARVTFTFRSTGPDAPPGYKAEYQPGPFAEDGSGNPVSVDGKAFLVVRFEPAAIADLSVESAPLTYGGPRSIKPKGVPHVVEIRLIGAFEGVVTWVIGLDSQRPIQIAATAGTPKLAITIG